MKENSYEHKTAFFISMTTIGVLCGLIALLGSLFYPVFYIHQSFISNYLQFKAIDFIPSDFVKGMSFPLYMGLLFLVFGSPIDLFLKNRENYGYSFKENVKKSFKELTLTLLKVVYYVLLFCFCFFLSIWLSNNVYSSLLDSFGEQQLVMIPFMFNVAIAFGVFTMMNSFIKMLISKRLHLVIHNNN